MIRDSKARFVIGDRVVICGLIFTRYLGKEGIIVEVKPSWRARAGSPTLDKYFVEFPEADRQWFFDTQLAPATSQGNLI